MTPDLSASVGAPLYLFKASDAPWLDNGALLLTLRKTMSLDGPELYRTRNGKLLMLWSSYDKEVMSSIGALS